jgi:hypothetical protein
MKTKQTTNQAQMTLRLVTGRPLPPPRAPRSASDDQLEFLLSESLKMVKTTGCGCYVRAKMQGRRHNKRKCGCRCGHKRAVK